MPSGLVVTNARVWTGDSGRPEVEALAVVGERLVATGPTAEIEAWRGPRTTVLDVPTVLRSNAPAR